MTDKPNLIHSRRSPHHSNKHLHSWNYGIRDVLALMKKNGIRIKHAQIFQMIELFFDLAFQAQMRGYTHTWPHRQRRMELHILKRTGPLRIQKHMAQQEIVYPDNYPGVEFVVEPEGDRFINYGYTFVPDLHVRRAIVDFINKNPEIAEKLIP